MNKDKKPISETHPELAKEAFGWDPNLISAGSDKKLQWKCKLGHIWLAVVYSRKDGNSCPYCGNQKVLTGFNDLATTHPELAKEADGWDPRKVIAGTPKKLQWKCSKGHSWIVNGNNRVNYKTHCPYCRNQKVLTGFNDLATTHPELAKEAHGWDPAKVIAGSHKKYEWNCQYKHKWKSTVKDRVRGNSCPICSNKLLLEGYNDLATTHPELAKEAHGWDPNKVIAGTTRKLKWKCSNGHIWNAVGYSRVFGSNCPTCSPLGFDPNKQAYIYFLIQPKWEMYQIGITNYPEDRIKTHKKNGFEIIELRGPMDGHTAQELETTILRFLKNQKADLSPEHIAGKFDGYSESWTIDSYKVNHLKELIDKASDAGF